MARQGNYVTVSGNNTNWTKSLSDSLAGLSRSFYEQAALEQAEEVRKAEAAESARRFGTEQAAREAESKATADHRKNTLKLQRDQFDQQQTQYRDAENRRIEQDKLEQKIRDEEANQERLIYDFRRSDRVFDESAYSEEIQRDLFALKSSINSAIAADKDALINGSVDQAIKVFETNLRNSGASDKEVAAKTAERRNDLLSLRDEIASSSLDEAGKLERINSLVDNQYKDRLTSYNSMVKSGRGLTKEQRVDYIIRQLGEDAPEKYNMGKLTSALYDEVAGLSNADTRAALQADADRANAARKEQIEFTDKYYKRAIDANGGRRFANNQKGIASAIESVGGIDIGMLDNPDVRKGFQFMLEEGVSPAMAAATVKYGIETDLIGDRTFPSLDSTEFAQLVDMAKQNSSVLSGGSNKPFINDRSYLFKPVAAKTIYEAQRAALEAPSVAYRRYGVNPEFDRALIEKQAAERDVLSKTAATMGISRDVLEKAVNNSGSVIKGDYPDIPTLEEQANLPVGTSVGGREGIDWKELERHTVGVLNATSPGIGRMVGAARLASTAASGRSFVPSVRQVPTAVKTKWQAFKNRNAAKIKLRDEVFSSVPKESINTANKNAIERVRKIAERQAKGTDNTVSGRQMHLDL